MNPKAASLSSGGTEGASVDKYLEDMKAARKGPAVLKLQLLLLRALKADVLIFAFEGGDDKIAYSRWISRLAPNLVYEPFPCSGKKYVLQLRDVVLRDLGGIGYRVYFFVDRDFDDLAGYSSHPSTFMTDRYSVDNYLVSEAILEEVLKNEFHCHGRPDVRQPIVELFQLVYTQFLALIRDINWRLFVARRLKLSAASTPDKLRDLVTIALEGVTAGPKSAEQLFPFPFEPAAADVSALALTFATLDPATRYRGKYSLEFFERWLDLLANDYIDAGTKFFGGISRVEKVRKGELVLGGFAAKSTPPDGLAEFLQAAAAA